MNELKASLILICLFELGLVNKERIKTRLKKPLLREIKTYKCRITKKWFYNTSTSEVYENLINYIPENFTPSKKFLYLILKSNWDLYCGETLPKKINPFMRKSIYIDEHKKYYCCLLCHGDRKNFFENLYAKYIKNELGALYGPKILHRK